MSTALIVIDYNSPVGPLLLAAIDDGICALEFLDERWTRAQRCQALASAFDRPVVEGQHEHLTRLRRELDDYFAGHLTEFRVPLVLRGTEFQRKVWSALRRIPYGETCSYADIARAVGSPKAVRAVGSANGQNRIAIVIPCHRVINTGGGIGGYGGGLWRKELLLELEGCKRSPQRKQGMLTPLLALRAHNSHFQ